MNAIKTRKHNGLWYAEVQTAVGKRTTGRYVSRRDAENAGMNLEKLAAVHAPAPALLMKRF